MRALLKFAIAMATVVKADDYDFAAPQDAGH
jgi:hypothetical protein